MKIIDTSFDAETRALLNRALKDVWSEVCGAPRDDSLDALVLRANLVLCVIKAANEGERDVERLRVSALQRLPMIKRDRY